MIRTQVQLPDDLYREAKRIAAEREITLAEVIRRGLEHMARVYPPHRGTPTAWQPPPPRHLGAFRAPVEEWRQLTGEGAPTR